MRFPQWADAIKQASIKYNIPVYIIEAVIQNESGGNPDAVGDGGAAVGLMQCHVDACITIGGDPKMRTDPAKAIDMGCDYLRWCLDRFPQSGYQVMLGLMAYNQGPTVVGNAFSYWKRTMALVINATE